MLILGIDPGTALIGYGLIEYKNKKAVIKEYGCFRTSPKERAPERLKNLYNQLTKYIKKHQPALLAVEDLFFFKNLKTAIKVSQARGVILLCGTLHNLPIFECTPLQVKQAVTGYGRAEKQQVQKMVKVILNLKEIPKPDDAADALAIALCAAHSFPQKNALTLKR